MFYIEFVNISTLGTAAEATITPQNFTPQGRFYLRYFAENNGEHYVALNPVENPDISNKSFTSEVKKRLSVNRSLSHPKVLINQMNLFISKWRKNTDKSFNNLPPELVKKILITAIRNCDNI